MRLLRTLAVVAALPLIGLLALCLVARGPFVPRARKVPTQPASVDRMREVVRVLAVDCAPRSVRDTAKLDRAATFVERSFRDGGDAPERMEYELREGRFRNVLVTRAGSEPALPVVVIGAHYDACGSTPGADDNASGVAALLELARLTRGLPHRRTWIFAAFSTEEPQFFGTRDMGSARLAEKLQQDGVRVHLMVALDMVGTFCDEPGCQTYPFPGLSAIYPSRGNYVAVVGDMGGGGAIALTKRGLLAAGVVPVVSFRGPRSAGWIDLSDHSSFWATGSPAVLVTDTALLRNPRYHGALDTPETLDYERMSHVVRALQGVLGVADGP